jgi:hypothetical protein
MNNEKPFEMHALNVGKLVGNLLSLEFLARIAIIKLDTSAAAQVQTQLLQVNEGDWVEVNALTNADDLTRTLENYNKRTPVEYRVEIKPITKLRDALAHGRMFGHGQLKTNAHLRLLKFSRKKQYNKVQVDLVVDMTEKWFNGNIRMLKDASGKIAKAIDYQVAEIK